MTAAYTDHHTPFYSQPSLIFGLNTRPVGIPILMINTRFVSH